LSFFLRYRHADRICVVTYNVDCHGKSCIQQEEDSFYQQIGLKFEEETNKMLHWSMALYGAETWTLRAADQKYLESFEVWCWRRMEKISWTDHVRN